MRLLPATTLIGSLLLATAPVALAAEPMQAGGAAFAARMQHVNTELALRNVGVLTRLFFKAYATALYMPAEVSPTRWRDDVAKSLEIEYFWDIEAAKFGPAGDAVLARMYDDTALAPIRERLALLNAAYVDVRKGDRYRLAYVPGNGTTLLHNDRPLITIEGADFAAIYFAIWLGDEPVDAGLRDELLATATPP